MLNAKYILAQNPQNGQEMVIPNPQAYGPCWFVKNVKVVKDDVEEIQAIGITDLKDTAIVQQSFARMLSSLNGIQLHPWLLQSSITIRLNIQPIAIYHNSLYSAKFIILSDGTLI
ncbi:MAG: hypothetical protein WDO19_33415 [Bacteroidota bacterium]